MPPTPLREVFAKFSRKFFENVGAKNFSKSRSRRRDQFGPKIVQIRAILAIFEPFKVFGCQKNRIFGRPLNKKSEPGPPPGGKGATRTGGEGAGGRKGAGKRHLENSAGAGRDQGEIIERGNINSHTPDPKGSVDISKHCML